MRQRMGSYMSSTLYEYLAHSAIATGTEKFRLVWQLVYIRSIAARSFPGPVFLQDEAGIIAGCVRKSFLFLFRPALGAGWTRHKALNK